MSITAINHTLDLIRKLCPFSSSFQKRQKQRRDVTWLSFTHITEIFNLPVTLFLIFFRMLKLVLSFAVMVGLCQAVLRVDDKRGFKLCNAPQHAQLITVEVDGPGCARWPCLIFPGRSGAFKISLYNPMDRPIHQVVSDIHGTLRLNGIAGLSGRQRVAMPGEVKKKACAFTHPGCPIPPQSYFDITKVIQVPMQARMAHGKMVVEFKVHDGSGRLLTCFTAPVILG